MRPMATTPSLLRIGFRDICRDLDLHEGTSVRIVAGPGRIVRAHLDYDGNALLFRTAGERSDPEIETGLLEAFPHGDMRRLVPSVSGVAGYQIRMPLPLTLDEARATLAGIRAGVSAVAIGQGLDEGRAVAAPGAVDGPPGGLQHGVRVVPVDDDRLQAVGGGPVGRRPLDGRHLADRRVLHVPVVLAHEDHRRLPDHGEVQRFVERADVGRPVAEKRHRNLIGPPHLSRPRGPVGDTEVGADDGVGAHHPLIHVGEMHRSPLTAQNPVLPPQQLGHGRTHLHAPSQRVGVTPVSGEGVVVGAHGHAKAGGDRLHPQ